MQALYWSILFLDSRNLAYRLLLIFSLFMVTVVYNFVLKATLPTTPYLTFLERYILLNYLLGVLLVALVVAMHFLHEKGRDQAALRFNSLSRLLYPVLFAVANGMLFWWVLG